MLSFLVSPTNEFSLGTNKTCLYLFIYFILQWVNDIGGYENLGKTLLKGRKSGDLQTFVPPEVQSSYAELQCFKGYRTICNTKFTA